MFVFWNACCIVVNAVPREEFRGRRYLISAIRVDTRNVPLRVTENDKRSTMDDCCVVLACPSSFFFWHH